MGKPTEDQIVAALAHLKDIAPKIVQRSAFGSNNRTAIEAQIVVLDTRRDLAYKYEDDRDREVLGAVEDAWAWLEGEYDEDESGPFREMWDSLIHEGASA